MSTGSNAQKADQIAYRFYTKLLLVLNHARSTIDADRPQAKIDKWFSIEIPDSELLKDHLKMYKTISAIGTPQPLHLQVVLVVPELSSKQVLTYHAPDSSRMRIDPTPLFVVLETWSLELVSNGALEDVPPPTLYKNGIPLFRSLYALLRLLPSWKLYKRLRRPSGRVGTFSISVRLRPQGQPKDTLDFDMPLSPNSPSLATQTHSFPSVPHPMGSFSLTSRFLANPDFRVEDLESLLSSRFLSLEEGPEFTPTLVKNQQRDSISGSPGSLPIKTSTSPPRLSTSPRAIAERFVLSPAASSQAALPLAASQSPKLKEKPLAASRPPTGSPLPAMGVSPSALSAASSTSAYSRDDGKVGIPAAARIRKESNSRVGSTPDLPSLPSPLPIRRPNVNPIHPFKSSTLSSGSPSLHSPSSTRQQSPLSGGPNVTKFPVPASPMGGARIPLPSSFDERPKMPTSGRKRYSSSFGHRYASSVGATSEGSSGPERDKDRPAMDRERVESAFFLSANTEDDDISAFVQDIDARKPLTGLRRTQDNAGSLRSAPEKEEQNKPGQNHEREPTVRPPREPLSRDSLSAPSSSSGVQTGLGNSRGGAMLTSETEVDARLKEMKETFLASLRDIDSGSTRRKTSSQDVPSLLPVTPGPAASPRSPLSDRRATPPQEGRASPFASRPASVAPSIIGHSGLSQASDEVLGKMSFEAPRPRKL